MVHISYLLDIFRKDYSTMALNPRSRRWSSLGFPFHPELTTIKWHTRLTPKYIVFMKWDTDFYFSKSCPCITRKLSRMECFIDLLNMNAVPINEFTCCRGFYDDTGCLLECTRWMMTLVPPDMNFLTRFGAGCESISSLFQFKLIWVNGDTI